MHPTSPASRSTGANVCDRGACVFGSSNLPAPPECGPAIHGPMIDGHGSHRRVWYCGLVAPTGVRTWGLPPGCPAAAHWLALLMYC